MFFVLIQFETFLNKKGRRVSEETACSLKPKMFPVKNSIEQQRFHQRRHCLLSHLIVHIADLLQGSGGQPMSRWLLYFLLTPTLFARRTFLLKVSRIHADAIETLSTRFEKLTVELHPS